ncbi:hypothetical protein [Catellatospora sp. NPDC049133]|uniref:hypothetical protein n=1 Tax=Catellatospora sp. NPDC049133 TaxID=3155499 RepID=UPI0033D9C2B5
MEQGKGAFAQARGVSVDEAVGLTRAYCRSYNLRLGDAARAMTTDSAGMPGLASR